MVNFNTGLKLRWPTMWKSAGLGCLLFGLSACSSFLPKSRTDTTSFENFDDARVAVETLVPMTSDRVTFEKNGLSVMKQPNSTLLTHAEIMRRFLPTAVLKRDDLDPGILACLEARDTCTGVEVIGAKIARERTGNFFADFFNFQRHTQTTGWRFNAVVLFVNDVVVYRAWSGQPAIKEIEETRNPLGPFQDIGPSTVPSVGTIR